MKKISQIIAYSILGIVVLGLVLTAILKKDFSPNINVPAYNNGTGDIFINSADDLKHEGLSSKDEKEYDKFVKLYNDSFKLTILYSVFSGEISKKQEITNYGKTKPQLSSGLIVTFNYSQNQILRSNGETYYESKSSDEVLYKQVFFAVENDKGLTTKKIYFYSENNSSYYQLTTLANFDSLYDYISEFPAFVEQD